MTPDTTHAAWRWHTEDFPHPAGGRPARPQHPPLRSGPGPHCAACCRKLDVADHDPADAARPAELTYPNIEQAAEVSAGEAVQFLNEGSEFAAVTPGAPAGGADKNKGPGPTSWATAPSRPAVFRTTSLSACQNRTIWARVGPRHPTLLVCIIGREDACDRRSPSPPPIRRPSTFPTTRHRMGMGIGTATRRTSRGRPYRRGLHGPPLACGAGDITHVVFMQLLVNGPCSPGVLLSRQPLPRQVWWPNICRSSRGGSKP